MTSIYNFKKIAVVPTSNDFLDIVLSKTQRKTPTVIHKNYAISRIRNFYMRKVKFTQDTFEEKLNGILEEFPVLDSIHPFYADLMNVLYDKDHYKLALGQINTAKHMINSVAKDYVKLLKFGDSLYRCKQLKKAALGRMATIMKRQKDSLVYLEQVRQHLARLPSIDPNTRTLLVCGYPNVGKSSFLNKITRADVDVQPYAFTTKSLFVGHMDYKYLRWQVIDTPGILDHPLEERNTIEMQSITALAHLRACIMFFMDLSEQCGYTIAEQCRLYHSIKPLFANKATLLVVNKIDIVRPEDLNPSDQALVKEIIDDESVELLQLSCYTDEGVMDVRNRACDKLLASRVEQKMQSNKISDVLNKLHLAQPQLRDNADRPGYIPEGALNRMKYDINDPNRPKLERDIEFENGGAGVFNVDLKKRYMLSNDEWKYDHIPEIMDGKNIADFVDPDIEEQLDALEREEERLVEEGFYDSDGNMSDPEEEAIRTAATEIRKKKQLIINASRDAKGKNRSTLIKKIRAQLSTKNDLKEHMASLDLDSSLALQNSVKSKKRGRSLANKQRDEDDMDIDDDEAPRTTSRAPTRDRSLFGVRDVTQKMESVVQGRKSRRRANLMAKAGEADRTILTKMPKHLFSGKRKNGSTDRR